MTRRLEQGTEIGTVDCPGCEAELPLKENVAGGVYYFCGAVLERNEAGKATEQCMTRFNYGRAASKRIIDDFLENKEDITDVKEPENREEDTTGHTAGEPTEENITGTDERGAAGDIETGSFAAGLKHFLTGD